MAKKFIATAIILACLCTPALADHWSPTASLVKDGAYMLVYVNPQFDDFAIKMGFARLGTFALFFVFPENKAEISQTIIDYLNLDPQTTPERYPKLLFFDPETRAWAEVPLPCQWLEGDLSL
jgi:hypothetical protein